MTKTRATTELVFAGILWGFGFVATVWSLRSYTPFETLTYRFIVAGLVGEVIYFVMRGSNFTTVREEVLRALPAGLLLAGMLSLQTIGLKFTTATKSGFITSLYVILVPLINTWFFKSRSSLKTYFFAFLALVGTFILMDAKISDVNVGDLWTLGCSVIAAFHIIYVGRNSHRIGNAFRFNNFQSLWCLLALLPFFFAQDTIRLQTDDTLAWVGILCLGVGSSLIAFYLQIRSQKILSDSTASMLFLLESPFAALFGFLILSERLNVFQLSGGILIMLASSLQILFDSSSKTIRKKPESPILR